MRPGGFERRWLFYWLLTTAYCLLLFEGEVDAFLEGLAGVEAGEVCAEADEGAGDAGADAGQDHFGAEEACGAGGGDERVGDARVHVRDACDVDDRDRRARPLQDGPPGFE